ncbi:MAG TPA: acyltransferase [Candidatus Aquabacterium excrementipullorum]|nr:acyltransferase [Candidatus Aquabacterium excrementipullorum]
MSSTPAQRPLHRNNFDLLRLVAAADVMALHIYDLTAAPELSWLHWIDTRLALCTFFIISGYLVFQSFEQTPRLGRYADKRLRRIVPAYAVVIVLSVLVGALVTRLPWADYWHSGTTWRYLVTNLAFLNFLQPTLPGVFDTHPYAAVNGALWTIKVELMFYMAVPVFVWLVRRLGHHLVLGAGFVLACLWWGGFTALALATGKGMYIELAKQMPGWLMFFLPGAWCFYEQARLRALGWRLGAASVALLALSYAFGLSYLYPLALAGCVFYAAFGLPRLGNPTRFGDLSYGLYILHFPIIQLLVHAGVFKASPWGGLALLIPLVLGAAWLSWHLVEAPMLRRRKPASQAVPV